ncbi:MAG: 4'-phosphopantetheinyl transferase superfamily protein [Aureispira sp.]|nr:4'-phosphopantetheinyl transferase superfamily protein [Aureispira sp.]
MISIFYSNSTEIKEKTSLNDLLQKLPKSMEERALRYKFAQDAFNFVLGRLLLKKGLETLGLPAQKLEDLYYNEEEKPLLEGISFSITHSQDLVACAFAAKGNLGLDLECARILNRKHFRHCFNEEEWSNISSDESLDTFYWYWTAKEAILKANGVGLGRLMDIKIKDKQSALFFTGEHASSWRLKNIDFGRRDAYACLCMEQDVDIKLKRISYF